LADYKPVCQRGFGVAYSLSLSASLTVFATTVATTVSTANHINHICVFSGYVLCEARVALCVVRLDAFSRKASCGLLLRSAAAYSLGFGCTHTDDGDS